jgi:hypothetical protein
MDNARKIRPLGDMYEPEEIAEVRAYVDRVFDNALDRYDTMRRNPFTSGGWVPSLDPIEPQKEDAVRAALARRWYAKHGPADADLQPLPLGYDEREPLKRGGAPHILAWYARSLYALDYDVIAHPSFYDYACGVMAPGLAPASITQDKQLQRRFPPRLLPGLGSGLMWRPPEEYELCRPSMKFDGGRRCKITDQTR